MNESTKCNIVSVGKRRDGGTRYWCLQHKADATAKYGIAADKCRYSHIPEITKEEIVEIDLSKYLGGVALWGAVPPIYDTTQQPLDHGIHVHARPSNNSKKEIDKTYRKVRLINSTKKKETSEIVELDAIYYMVTSIFGYPMKYVECTRCQYPHLDKDWFSLHPHQSHLCAGCGMYFRDTDIAVGNPIIKTQELFNITPKPTKKINRPKEIKQSDFKGGIQIWGSNSAIFWTGEQQEEEGIHLHAYLSDDSEPTIDDTFSELIVDGIKLDPQMVRMLMAQNSIPHIENRISSFNCPTCKKPHFSDGELSFTPSKTHTCKFCNNEFQSKGKLRNLIGNPLVNMLSELAKNAVREPQKHKTDLIPETL